MTREHIPRTPRRHTKRTHQNTREHTESREIDRTEKRRSTRSSYDVLGHSNIWTLKPLKTHVSDLFDGIFLISLPWRTERQRGIAVEYADILGHYSVVPGRALLNPKPKTPQTHAQARTLPTEGTGLGCRLRRGTRRYNSCVGPTARPVPSTTTTRGEGQISFDGKGYLYRLAHTRVWKQAGNAGIILVLEDDVLFPQPENLVRDMWNALRLLSQGVHEKKHQNACLMFNGPQTQSSTMQLVTHSTT